MDDETVKKIRAFLGQTEGHATIIQERDENNFFVHKVWSQDTCVALDIVDGEVVEEDVLFFWDDYPITFAQYVVEMF